MSENKFIKMLHSDFAEYIGPKPHLSANEENELLDSTRWDLMSVYIQKSNFDDIPCRKFIKTAPEEYVREYISKYPLYADALRELILRNDYALLKMAIDRQIFCVGEQRNILRHGSDELLKKYFKDFCFAPPVEKELLQSGRTEVIACYLLDHKVWPSNRNLIPKELRKQNKNLGLWDKITNLFSPKKHPS